MTVKKLFPFILYVFSNQNIPFELIIHVCLHHQVSYPPIQRNMSLNTEITLFLFLEGDPEKIIVFDSVFRIKCSLEKKVNTVVTSTTQTNPQNVPHLFVNTPHSRVQYTCLGLNMSLVQCKYKNTNQWLVIGFSYMKFRR